jgi:hypothetical protein
MSDHWFVITNWNDNQGRQRRRVEHWVDTAAFSKDDFLPSPDVSKAKVLSYVYTLDLPAGSPSEKVQHLIAADEEKLIRALILYLVPTVSGEERWVHYDLVNTREQPLDPMRTLVAAEYGISVYRLATPIDLPDDDACSTNA